jgi:hypothetical protein
MKSDAANPQSESMERRSPSWHQNSKSKTSNKGKRKSRILTPTNFEDI